MCARRRGDAFAIVRVHIRHPGRVRGRGFIRTIAERIRPPRARPYLIGDEIPFPNAFADDVHRESEAAFVGLNDVSQALLLSQRPTERARPRANRSTEHPVPTDTDKHKSEGASRDQQDFSAPKLPRAGRQRVGGDLLNDPLLLQYFDRGGHVCHCGGAPFAGDQHVGPRVDGDLDRILDARVERMPPKGGAGARRGINLSSQQQRD